MIVVSTDPIATFVQWSDVATTPGQREGGGRN